MLASELYPFPTTLLPDVLAVSLAALVLLRPLPGPGSLPDNFALAYLNPAAQRLLALPERPVATTLTCLPALHGSGVRELCQQAFATAQAHNDFYYYSPHLGQLLRLAARRSGEHLLLSIATEATQPGRAAAGLGSQPERVPVRLDDLFMQAPAAICVLDGPKLVYELVNPAYQRVFPGRVLLGKPLVEALPELRDTPIPGLLGHVYATGETFVARELPLQMARVEGGPLEEIYWTFTYQARRNAHEQIDGVLVFAHDVTEQVRARHAVEAGQRQSQTLADELSRANTQLTRTNLDLDNFIYTASHDMRAPISNLEGLLHVLQRELALPPAEADVATVLHLMQDSIRRFQRTITYLTDISKLPKATSQPLTPVVLADLVEALRLDMAPQLAASEARLDVEISNCHTVALAEKNLRSIVYNLLSNALKYRSPGRPPHVQLRCHATEQHTVLEVQDNGLGLTPEQQGKLFGMFQRLHDHVEGSGIGLYMVKKLVTDAGGYLEVDSQLGTGSTFRVLLPKP